MIIWLKAAGAVVEIGSFRFGYRASNVAEHPTNSRCRHPAGDGMCDCAATVHRSNVEVCLCFYWKRTYTSRADIGEQNGPDSSTKDRLAVCRISVQ